LLLVFGGRFGYGFFMWSVIDKGCKTSLLFQFVLVLQYYTHTHSGYSI